MAAGYDWSGGWGSGARWMRSETPSLQLERGPLRVVAGRKSLDGHPGSLAKRLALAEST